MAKSVAVMRRVTASIESAGGVDILGPLVLNTWEHYIALPNRGQRRPNDAGQPTRGKQAMWPHSTVSAGLRPCSCPPLPTGSPSTLNSTTAEGRQTIRRIPTRLGCGMCPSKAMVVRGANKAGARLARIGNNAGVESRYSGISRRAQNESQPGT
jgi:hypothetical protein